MLALSFAPTGNEVVINETVLTYNSILSILTGFDINPIEAIQIAEWVMESEPGSEYATEIGVVGYYKI